MLHQWATTNPRNVPWETRFDELQAFVVSAAGLSIRMLPEFASQQADVFPSRTLQANYGHAEGMSIDWEGSSRIFFSQIQPFACAIRSSSPHALGRESTTQQLGL
jgi:hypothetical protein